MSTPSTFEDQWKAHEEDVQNGALLVNALRTEPAARAILRIVGPVTATAYADARTAYNRLAIALPKHSQPLSLPEATTPEDIDRAAALLERVHELANDHLKQFSKQKRLINAKDEKRWRLFRSYITAHRTFMIYSTLLLRLGEMQPNADESDVAGPPSATTSASGPGDEPSDQEGTSTEREKETSEEEQCPTPAAAVGGAAANEQK